MKRRPLILVLLAFFLLCLLFPTDVHTGAAYGLDLWYQILVPSLLPFFLLTSLLCHLQLTQSLNRYFGIISRRLFGLPEAYTSVWLLGFLSGMPVCASLLSDTLKDREAVPLYPLLLANHLSPGFLSGYVCAYLLGTPSMALPYTLLFYLLHILLAVLINKTWLLRRQAFSPAALNGLSASASCDAQFPSADRHKTASLSELLEVGIASASRSMLRIAFYVMLFSILANFYASCCLRLVRASGGLKFLLYTVPYLTGILEITTGCHLIQPLPMTTAKRLFAVTALVSFGGLSGLLQTRSMLSGHAFPLFTYIKIKAGIALITAAAMLALYVLIHN